MSAATATSPKIETRISADKLTAAVFVESGTDREASISAEQIVKALRESNVIVNPQIEASAQKLAQVYNDRKELPGEIVLVQGRAAVDAADESVRWSDRLNTELASWQEGAPEDSYSHEAVIVVQESEIFGTVEPARPPTHGVDVHGQKLVGQGQGKPLNLDESVTLDETATPATLTSTKTGRVTLRNTRLCIDDALMIEGDVGPATGNVDSQAHVFVAGSILDRFEVASTMSVVVGGSIEAAKVRAGDDVLVKRGIVGRGQGTVMAAGNVVAKFCSQTDVSVGQDLKVAAQLMSCNLLVEGSLVAGDASLVGGLAWIRQGGAVDTLGSDACIPTRVFVDEDPVAIQAAAIEEAKRRRESGLEGDGQPSSSRSVRSGSGSGSSSPKTVAGLLVQTIIYPKTRISVGVRVFSFENELKGPVLLTTSKVRNATELVAIHQKTDHVQKLRSQTLSAAELAKEFTPLNAVRTAMLAAPEEEADQKADGNEQV